jgi:hypothetical protein
MTGQDDAAVRSRHAQLEDATGLTALQLRMQRAYRIDLALTCAQHGPRTHAAAPEAMPVAEPTGHWPPWLEDGLPLVPRPFDAWAQALGRTGESVLATRCSSGWTRARCGASAPSCATTSWALTPTP